MTTPIVYVTHNLINGKKYLGKYSGNGKKDYLGSGVAIKRAIAKYGKDNFYRETIKECSSLQEASDTERKLSYEWNVVNDPSWYNMCYGGGGMFGFHHSDATKQLLSEINMSEGRRNNIARYSSNWKGKSRGPQSDEHKKKHSLSKIGIPMRVETKQKLTKLVSCPHCSLEGGITAMSRWHFDKCRNKPL